MNTITKAILYFAVSIFLFTSCSSEEVEEVTPENRFIKIYNHPDFSATHYALDVKQTADNGYIMLAQTRVTESDFGGIYLVKADAEGNVLWEYAADATVVSPAPALMNINGGFYFMCMDNTGLGTILMQVNEAGATADIVRVYPDITFPLHASATPDGGILVLSYNRDRTSSTLSKINASFGLSWQENYNVQEENADEPIFDHLLNTDKRLPFFTGVMETGGYFFNGLSNFTLSLSFVDPSDGSQLGVMNGFRLDGAVSAMQHLQGSTFAVSRYTFGTNYILPGIDIATDAVSNSEDLEGNISAELATNADVRILRTVVDTTNLLVYAANSKSNQVVLYGYNENDGALLGSKYLGFSEGFEVAGIIETSDKGLAILCTTNVAGRFRRMALFKISEGDIKGLAGIDSE